MSESTPPSAIEAARLGLLKFPDSNHIFTGRRGNEKPFVIDTRGAGAIPRLRRLIIDEMKNRISGFTSFDSIGGIAKSGTVWAAWLAWELNLPFISILLEGPRSSGLNREIEGDAKGKQVILVDNWVRTGESIDKAIRILHSAGAVPSAILVVTRQPELSFQIPIFTVWELADLVQASKELGLIPNNFQFNGY